MILFAPQKLILRDCFSLIYKFHIHFLKYFLVINYIYKIYIKNLNYLNFNKIALSL